MIPVRILGLRPDQPIKRKSEANRNYSPRSLFYRMALFNGNKTMAMLINLKFGKADYGGVVSPNNDMPPEIA